MTEARRWMAVAAGGFALLAALCLFWLDPLIASATAGGARDTFWDIGTALLDLLVLKEVDNFFPGALLILAALVALAVRSTRRSFGWPLLYVALVQFLSTVAADLSKPPFGRLRPFEAAARDVPDAWFVGANSFPSGHAAFYAGLFFPLMILFPRGAPLLAVPPLFIAIARVAEHDHYASDVAASLAFAAGLSAALAFLVRRAPPESASPSP